MTDNEIIKAKELLKKLEEAYNAYYDTNKGMPYDIDKTIRETALCLESAINEINRLKAGNERLSHEIHVLKSENSFLLKSKGNLKMNKEVKHEIKQSILEVIKEYLEE